MSVTLRKVLTHSKRGEGMFVLHHLRLAIPTLGNELLGTFKATLYCKLRVHTLEVTPMRRTRCTSRMDVHLKITQRGANTFVLPGMKVSPIMIPCGGVSLETTVVATGYRRIASLIVPIRWGKEEMALRSRGSIPASSAWIFSASSGCLARQ